jgi:hypothetical protein
MLVDDGVIDTDTTGAGVTVTDAVPLFPSLVAVIVAEPGATAVTRPPVEMVATAVLLEVKFTGRPVRGLP